MLHATDRGDEHVIFVVLEVKWTEVQEIIACHFVVRSNNGIEEIFVRSNSHMLVTRFNEKLVGKFQSSLGTKPGASLCMYRQSYDGICKNLQGRPCQHLLPTWLELLPLFFQRSSLLA